VPHESGSRPQAASPDAGADAGKVLPAVRPSTVKPSADKAAVPAANSKPGSRNAAKDGKSADAEKTTTATPVKPAAGPAGSDPTTAPASKVVALDAFRKKS
jgi:hypothetical protein